MKNAAAALAQFWALPPADRRVIWGDSASVGDALAGYDPRYISDGELGGP